LQVSFLFYFLVLFVLDSVGNKTGFTDTAIAGLAAVEDFSAIKLKHSNSETIGYDGEQASPFNDLMLIQIKGICFFLQGYKNIVIVIERIILKPLF
jgi:hypothetical protein